MGCLLRFPVVGANRGALTGGDASAVKYSFHTITYFSESCLARLRLGLLWYSWAGSIWRHYALLAVTLSGRRSRNSKSVRKLHNRDHTIKIPQISAEARATTPRAPFPQKCRSPWVESKIILSCRLVPSTRPISRVSLWLGGQEGKHQLDPKRLSLELQRPLEPK